jgi:hypothetical protein
MLCQSLGPGFQSESQGVRNHVPTPLPRRRRLHYDDNRNGVHAVNERDRESINVLLNE